MASAEVNQMLAVAASACEDKKAEDIRILALDPTESGLTDYFLICTGTNDRQTVAITDEIEIRLKREFGNYPNSVEGRRQGEWILMDYVDFIVHVFLPEKRAYYGLERLRPSATTLSVADLNAEIKAAITAHRANKPTRKTAKPTELDTSAPTEAKRTVRKKAAGTALSLSGISDAGTGVGLKRTAKKTAAMPTRAAGKSAAKSSLKKAIKSPAKKIAARKRSS